MSDARLRELERRFQSSGTAADEGALLRERWKVGELTEDKLLLAAYAGSQAAGLAVGRTPEAPDEPARWVSRLRHVLGYPAELAAAAARLTAWLSAAWVLRHREGLARPEGRSDADLDRALALIARGWEFPTPDREAALRNLIPRYPSAREETDADEPAIDPDDPFALEAVYADLQPDPVLEVLQETLRALFPASGTTGISPAADAAGIAARVAGDAVVLASFQRAVREWALGSPPDADELLGSG